MAIDFEAEGLLDDLEGEHEREARLELLRDLEADGVPLEELKRASEEGRLALLPVERAVEGEGPRCTVEEVAERAGLELDSMYALLGALGVARPEPGERAFSDGDVKAATNFRLAREAGMPERDLVELTRVMSQGMASVAEAVARPFATAMMKPGDTERDLARRYGEATRALNPLLSESLLEILRIQQRESLRRAAVSAEEIASGRLSGSRPVAVCFADLVGFTRLGERVPPDQLSEVVDRLAELAQEVVEPPVRLVKTVGDAAMLVAREPEPILESALAFVEAAEAQSEDFPLVHAGLATGEALPRAGDWYGPPVNLASRITDFARPGSVVAAKDVRDSVDGDYRWSFAGRRHFKGVRGEVSLYRVRRTE